MTFYLKQVLNITLDNGEEQCYDIMYSPDI